MKHTLYQLIILCLLATVSSCRVDELEGILDSSTAGSLSDPELQWDSDRHEVTFGEECDFPVLANRFGVEVSYSSSDTGVATISGTGEITLCACREQGRGGPAMV